MHLYLLLRHTLVTLARRPLSCPCANSQINKRLFATGWVTSLFKFHNYSVPYSFTKAIRKPSNLINRLPYQQIRQGTRMGSTDKVAEYFDGHVAQEEGDSSSKSEEDRKPNTYGVKQVCCPHFNLEECPCDLGSCNCRTRTCGSSSGSPSSERSVSTRL